MTIITLTQQGAPSRPITLNTDFIAAVNPLRKTVPDANTQSVMATKTVYAGTEVVLSNGTKYNVLEAYPAVVDQLNSASQPAYSTEPMPEEPSKALYPAVGTPPPGTVLAASGVAQMANTVAPTEVPETYPALSSPAIAEPVVEESGFADNPPEDTPDTPDELKQVEVVRPPEEEKLDADKLNEGKINEDSVPSLGESEVGITKFGDERSAPENVPGRDMTPAEKRAATMAAKKQQPLKGVQRAGGGPTSEVRVDASPTEHTADVDD